MSKYKNDYEMAKYIGTKIVQAVPAVRINGQLYTYDMPIPRAFHREEGYKVVYPDGYVSFSPKSVFEESYRRTDDLSFGLAIEAAKRGHRIARRGWNGKDQYIELAHSISYVSSDLRVINCNHDRIGNKAFSFVGTSGIQIGWLATQSDMLADDWYIVE